MNEDKTGWRWLNGSEPANHEATANDLALAKAFARCFSTPEGEKVVAYLRSITLERHLGPLSSDAALRHLEGQRHLAAHIFTLTARGRSGK